MEAHYSSGNIAERVAGLPGLFHQELVGPLGPGRSKAHIDFAGASRWP